MGKGSPEREAEIKELVRFVDWAHRAGVRRLIVNGSFTTEKVSPNDVDMVILPGPDYPRDQSPVSEEKTAWPFLHIVVAVDEADLERWAIDDFGRDRMLRRRGVLEMTL